MIREIAYDEIFDAQTHFRLIMDSIARPGKINILNSVAIEPPHNLNKASALIGLALLNADVSFFVSENANMVSTYFIVNTASIPQTADQADFLFLQGNNTSENVENAKTGTLSYPETGAFIIIDVEEIFTHHQADTLKIQLKGPGVKGLANVFVKGLNIDLLKTIKEKNSEYPLGVDTILTDKKDWIVCMPRSNIFSF